MTTTLLKQSISMAEALSVSVTGIIVVMIILALLAVIVVLLSKTIRIFESKTKKKSKATQTESIPTPVKSEKPQAINNGHPLPETQSAGTLDLYKTDEKTAAIIMAIVSNESGIPLNRLEFKSIKLIEE
ncbi:MAG: OadG family protein [Oscillospiraceae bacterium]|nr:OadG family protein [Oscillospiraceae bacterium]